MSAYDLFTVNLLRRHHDQEDSHFWSGWLPGISYCLLLMDDTTITGTSKASCEKGEPDV